MNVGAFGENFPYSNFHDLNLDWILKTLKELQEEFKNYSAINQIVFADPPEWDFNSYYKKNTLVMDDNINGYIALQDVPAGIPLTNTDYWKMIYPFEQNYQDLRQEVITYINDNLENVELEIAETLEYAKTKEPNNANRKVLVIGDSYTVYYQNLLFNSLINFAKFNNNNCHNLAVSGASFSNQSNSFLSQLMGFTGDKTEITDILVIGGINDTVLSFPTDTNQLTTAMYNFEYYLNSNFPNARVYIFYVGGCMPNTQYYGTHNANSQEWVSYYYTTYFATEGYNTCIIDSLHLIDAYYSSDGVHPTENGIRRIAQEVASRINGITPSIKIPPSAVPITRNPSLTSVSETITYSVNDNIVSLNIDKLIAYVPANFSFNKGTPLKICDLGNCRIRTRISTNTDLLLNLFDPDSINFIQINAELYIQDGALYLEPFEVEERAWNNYTSRTGTNEAFISTVQPITLTTSLFNIN